MSKPDLILTSDWHLRESTPVSRIDDFWEAQWRKVDFVSFLQKEYDCPVIHAGDLFHIWKPSPRLLSYAIQRLPKEFYTLYGNHDLPQHNLLLKEKTGIYTLQQANILKVLECCHWDKPPDKASFEVAGKKILVWHYFVYQLGNKDVYMSEIGKNSNLLLRKYKQFDLIVTGDNHQSFMESLHGRTLINPGSLMRQSANQLDFQPKVYLYYAKENRVEVVPIPIENDVFDLSHLKVQQEKDERIQAFVESLNKDWKSTISFEENLRIFFEKNNVDNQIRNLILEALENE